MKYDVKFFKCSHCGNVAEMVYDAGVNIVCCGEKMGLLEPGTTDASTEKHVPVVSQQGNVVTVKVGSAEHPMTEEHHIAFIQLVTDRTIMRADLPKTGSPTATFTLADGEKVVGVYEYCNLHGLWKA